MHHEKRLNSTIRLLLFFTFFANFGGGVLTPLWGEFADSIGGDLTSAGNAVFVYFVGLAIFSYLAGRLLEKYPRPDNILIAAICLGILVYILYFFVRNPWELYIVQGLLSIAAAGLVPCLLSLVSDHLEKSHDKFTWGMYNFSFNLATALAALFGAWLAHHISLQAAFGIMLCNATVALILAVFVKIQARKSVP